MGRENLTVTAVAASRSMCLLADVKTELEITGSGEDARLSALIRAASDFIMTDGELLDGRDPWLQTYLEKRPGEGGVDLPVSRWPIKGEPVSVTLGTGSSPSTIDSTTYSTAGRARDRIYRAGGWNLTHREAPKAIPVHGDRDLEYNVAYSAGWVMPDQLSTAWAATTAYAAGVWVQDQNDLDYPLIFEVTTAGTSDSSEPDWSSATADGDEITDDGVTWTAREQRLPDALEVACKMLVVDWSQGFTPANVQYEQLESWSIRYMSEQAALSGAVRSLVRPYR